MDNCNGIPHEVEFGLSQKEVHFIYVQLVNRIPQKEFGIISFRKRYTLFIYV